MKCLWWRGFRRVLSTTGKGNWWRSRSICGHRSSFSKCWGRLDWSRTIVIGGICEMKKRIVNVVLAVGILGVLAGAQDTMKKDAPPKPAVGPSQALLENWN